MKISYDIYLMTSVLVDPQWEGWMNHLCQKPSVTLKARISKSTDQTREEKAVVKVGQFSCDEPPTWSPAKIDQMRIDIDFISRKVKEIAPATAISASSTLLNAGDIFATSGTVVEMSVLVVLMFAD
jgi:hypothetical protein